MKRFITNGFSVDAATEDLINRYLDAILKVQQGSNVDMYKDQEGDIEDKYNYNNVWHLVKTSKGLNHWKLLYEGAFVIEVQEIEGNDVMYLVYDFNADRDTQVERLFFKAAGI